MTVNEMVAAYIWCKGEKKISQFCNVIFKFATAHAYDGRALGSGAVYSDEF